MEASLGLFELNPFIDRIIPCRGPDIYFWSLPEANFDIFSPYFTVNEPIGEDIFNLKPAYRFDLNRKSVFVIQQIADYFGLRMDNVHFEIYTSPEDDTWANNFVKPWNGKKRVYVNRRSSTIEKNYPDNLWQKVFTGLEKAGAGRIVFLEHKQDGLDFSRSKLIEPSIGLRRFVALAKLFDCIITVDSFAGHLAAALGVTAVVLFGPTNALAFGHNGNRNIRPSACPVCADSKRLKECIDYKCMSQIAPESIVEEVMDILF
jgi:ADP-heptose:LPS heptosyltransferase